jgi:hypothetical protein
MKRISLALCVGLAAGLVGLSAQTAPVPKTDRAVSDKAMTVTGCVAEGTEAGTYTLASATIVGNLPSSPTTAGTAGTTGTEKSASMEHSASYQLKGENLKDLVGHQVEAVGTTSGDKRVDKSASAEAPATTKDTRPILTVTSVKLLSATCP